MPQDVFELPGPEGNTIVGNLIDLSNDPLGFLSQCRDYGDIVPLRLGLTPVCLIVNPDLIEQVLKDRETFVKSRGFRVLKTLLGEGLLTAEGESWFWQRRLAQPVFHQKRINSYGATMVEYSDRMLQTWHDGETHDIHADMMRLTLRCVQSMALRYGSSRLLTPLPKSIARQLLQRLIDVDLLCEAPGEQLARAPKWALDSANRSA